MELNSSAKSAWTAPSRFVAIMITANAICIPLLIFLPSYYNFKASESLSLYAKDGWCNPGQGIGIHCFGDFFYTFRFTEMIDPWSNGFNPQPPLGTFFYQIFSWYTVDNPNSKIPLLVYLVGCICAVLFPAWHLGWKNRKSIFLTISLSLATLTFAPVLVALDRGSNQLLMVPFVYLFVRGVIDENNRKVLIFGAILVLIKPQMVLLGIIFILNRDIRNSLKWAILSAVVTLSSFLLYPTSYVKNIKDYFQQLIVYQEYIPAGTLFPVNISISNLWSAFHRMYFEIFPNQGHIEGADSWKYYSPFVTLGTLVIVAAVSWFFGPQKTPLTKSVIAVSLPAIIPNVSFHYYLCVFLAVYLILVIQGLEIFDPANKGKSVNQSFYSDGFLGGRFRRLALLGASVFLFVPWPLPWSLISEKLPPLISSTWLLGQILLILSVGILIFSRGDKNSGLVTSLLMEERNSKF
jgi:hypothetical protein